jgi:TonB family protein
MNAPGLLLFAAILILVFPGYADPQSGMQAQPVGAETFYFLLESAEKGSPSAQFRLGMVYLQGNGVTREYSEAEKWFRKATEQHNAPAQSMLGVIYATDIGVTKDYVQAYIWLTLSIDESKDKQAPFFQQTTDLRDTIIKEMTPQQIDEARELVEKRKSARLISPKKIPGSVLKSQLIKHVTVLIVTVDEEGNVAEIKVASGNEMLTCAAVDAVKQWKYTPTLLDGMPIPVIATVTVYFRLGR